MEITPAMRKVVGLVEQARDGEICLPNFQRDFVWTREEVADLVRSILRGYFIGSLLLLQCDPDKVPFAPVRLRGARPSEAEPRPIRLVLDGQQRLTSLLYALTAPNLTLKDSRQRRWYFVDLRKLLEEPHNDEIVFDCAVNELEGLDKSEVQYGRRVLPCTKLLDAGDFNDWLWGLSAWLQANDSEGWESFNSSWRNAWSRIATAFQTFEVPLVELPRVEEDDPESIGRVCAIFEKLNSTGVELSVYDLLTARLYPSGVRVHDLWEESCNAHKLLREWSDGNADTNKFGVLILRTLALLRGFEVKSQQLIGLKSQDFERDWRRAAAAVERALELLTRVAEDGFGVFARKWLPGFGFLPVLAALRREIEDRKLGPGARAELRRWYWCNVFLERFSSGVESKSRKDYSEMLAHWTEGTVEPTVFAEAQARIGAPGFSIRSSASYSSAVYSGVFCLLALGGAKDWSYGEAIDLQRLEDHHIFPQAWLRTHGISARGKMNSVVNRTLVSDDTNKKIMADAPAHYLLRPDVFPDGATSEVLVPHFIDEIARDWMSIAVDDLSRADAAAFFDEFCTARETKIISCIRDACGVTAVSGTDAAWEALEPPTEDWEEREQEADGLQSTASSASESSYAEIETARRDYAVRAEQALNVSLHKRDDTLYSSADGTVAVVCLVSRPYERGNTVRFWFGLSSLQRAKLKGANKSIVVFGCGIQGKEILVPLSDAEQWLGSLSQAQQPGGPRWMFDIAEESGRLALRTKQGLASIDISSYVLPDGSASSADSDEFAVPAAVKLD